MKDRFKPENLKEAREARGMTMAGLALKCGVTRQAISLFENGSKAPGAETIFEISKALKIPISFFFNDRPRTGSRSGPLNFRKFDSATKSARTQASVMELWAADLHTYLSQFIEAPKANMPFFRIDDFEQLAEDDIEWFASETRKHWGLGNGPISNIRLLFENNGVLVCRIPLGERLDAYSCWRDERPVIVIGNKIPHARSRFDLCHELGHLIMHKAVSDEHHQDKELFKKIENQAHMFAAAFLMPEQSFSKELYSISLSAFVEVKVICFLTKVQKIQDS